MLTDLEIQKAIRSVAKKYGQTPAQVRHNIQVMLDESRASTDERHKEVWANTPHAGETPTLEEVMRYTAERIAARSRRKKRYF